MHPTGNLCAPHSAPWGPAAPCAQPACLLPSSSWKSLRLRALAHVLPIKLCASPPVLILPTPCQCQCQLHKAALITVPVHLATHGTANAPIAKSSHLTCLRLLPMSCFLLGETVIFWRSKHLFPFVFNPSFCISYYPLHPVIAVYWWGCYWIDHFHNFSIFSSKHVEIFLTWRLARWLAL